MTETTIAELSSYIAEYVQEELSRGLPPEHVDASLIQNAIDAYLGGAGETK